MRFRGTIIGIFGLGVALSSATASAETVEEVGKKIAAATEKLISFSAKSKSVIKTTYTGNMNWLPEVDTIERTTEILRKGADLLMRVEYRRVITGEVYRTKSYLQISDGSFTYVLTEGVDMIMGGRKSVEKYKMQRPDADPFKDWRAGADLKVLPEAFVDGRAVWVIERIPKPREDKIVREFFPPQFFWRDGVDVIADERKTVIYFDKESGQLIKMVTNWDDGDATIMTFSDIKVNGSISPDRFVFEVPPGVEVKDKSK